MAKFLIIGLGNPGSKYEKTWHNLGRLTVIAWQQKFALPEFSLNKKFNALISESQNAILLLPETFMNQSGQAVKKAMVFYKVKPHNLIVIHDDADLALGEVKLSKNRGSAGHKGVESIISHLKTKNFTRIRIGVRPENYVPGSKSLNKFVLKKIARTEKRTINETIHKANIEIEKIVK